MAEEIKNTENEVMTGNFIHILLKKILLRGANTKEKEFTLVSLPNRTDIFI